MKKFLMMVILVLGWMTMGCNKTASDAKSENVNSDAQEVSTEADPDDDVKGTVTPQREAQEEESENRDDEASAKGPVVVSVADDGFLNIREMPVASSKIVGKLLTGGRGARYLGSTGRWIKVRYDGVVGFVNGHYAQIRGLEEQSLRVPGAKGRVHYVVIGSFQDLNEAKKTVEVLPDALDDASIFRAQDKGKTVYRLCAGCYYKQADAQRQVEAIREYLDRPAWVWSSDGVAPCVYQGIGHNGELVDLGPQ